MICGTFVFGKLGPGLGLGLSGIYGSIGGLGGPIHQRPRTTLMKHVSNPKGSAPDTGSPPT